LIAKAFGILQFPTIVAQELWWGLTPVNPAGGLSETRTKSCWVFQRRNYLLLTSIA